MWDLEWSPFMDLFTPGGAGQVPVPLKEKDDGLNDIWLGAQVVYLDGMHSSSST